MPDELKLRAADTAIKLADGRDLKDQIQARKVHGSVLRVKDIALARAEYEKAPALRRLFLLAISPYSRIFIDGSAI